MNTDIDTYNYTELTEEQIFLLSCLNKYSALFYLYSDYHNYSKWLEDEIKLDTVIDSVRSGEYKDDETITEYINNCIAHVTCKDKDHEEENTD